MFLFPFALCILSFLSLHSPASPANPKCCCSIFDDNCSNEENLVCHTALRLNVSGRMAMHYSTCPPRYNQYTQYNYTMSNKTMVKFTDPSYICSEDPDYNFTISEWLHQKNSPFLMNCFCHKDNCNKKPDLPNNMPMGIKQVWRLGTCKINTTDRYGDIEYKQCTWTSDMELAKMVDNRQCCAYRNCSTKKGPCESGSCAVSWDKATKSVKFGCAEDEQIKATVDKKKMSDGYNCTNSTHALCVCFGYGCNKKIPQGCCNDEMCNERITCSTGYCQVSRKGKIPNAQKMFECKEKDESNSIVHVYKSKMGLESKCSTNEELSIRSCNCRGFISNKILPLDAQVEYFQYWLLSLFWCIEIDRRRNWLYHRISWTGLVVWMRSARTKHTNVIQRRVCVWSVKICGRIRRNGGVRERERKVHGMCEWRRTPTSSAVKRTTPANASVNSPLATNNTPKSTGNAFPRLLAPGTIIVEIR